MVLDNWGLTGNFVFMIIKRALKGRLRRITKFPRFMVKVERTSILTSESLVTPENRQAVLDALHNTVHYVYAPEDAKDALDSLNPKQLDKVVRNYRGQEEMEVVWETWRSLALGEEEINKD